MKNILFASLFLYVDLLSKKHKEKEPSKSLGRKLNSLQSAMGIYLFQEWLRALGRQLGYPSLMNKMQTTPII